MKGVKGVLGWFFRHKLSGRLFTGCSGLFAFFCICSFLGAIITQSNPTSEKAPSTSDLSNIQTAIVETIFAGISQTASANTPTQAFNLSAEATSTAGPTLSATVLPTSTPEQLATLSSLGISCVPSTTQQEEGIVVDIIDGDTIDVNINGKIFRVRYMGIDTPERNESFYDQATALNRDLVSGKRVLLVKDVSETDRYGRLLRYAFAEDIFVNHELVMQGYALASTYPPDVACSDFFANAQQQAQSAQSGLWVLVPLLPATGNESNGSDGSANNCNPAYPDVCLQDGIGDYDCAGGSGNGPNYIRGPIRVLPPDPFELDRDSDGVGCEG